MDPQQYEQRQRDRVLHPKPLKVLSPPAVVAVRVELSTMTSGERIVRFVCPWCYGTHEHGAGYQKLAVGMFDTRRSHCRAAAAPE